MANYRTYQIIRSVNDLPPRNVKVFTLIDPLDIDLVQDHNEIAIDIVIDNQSTTTSLTITLNDQDSFPLLLASAYSSSDVLISRFKVTGHTTGVVIVHTISITLLNRLNSIEVR